jgi:prophage antirepressor-like protein
MSTTASSPSAVVPFQFESATIRTVTLNGDPWFVAKDVCEVLGFDNPRQALSTHLDDDEKGVQNLDTPGGRQQVNIISESGLYTLIVRSNKPQAKPFRKWVTAEVLPAIRKTGAYTLPSAAPAADSAAALNRFRVFTFYGKELTVYIGQDGAPWFRAADIARVLGYRNLNIATFKLCDPRGRQRLRCTCRNGAAGTMVFIDEANLFRLLLRTSKGNTDALQRFFAETVLPEVRAAWSHRAAGPAVLPTPDDRVAAWYDQVIKQSRLLWWFDHDGVLRAKSIHPDAYVMPIYRLPEMIAAESMNDKEWEALPRIIEAAARRMVAGRRKPDNG